MKVPDIDRLREQLEDLKREETRRLLASLHETECEKLREEIRKFGKEPCCRVTP